MKFKGRQSTNITDLTTQKERARIQALKDLLTTRGQNPLPAGLNTPQAVTQAQIRAYEALMGPGSYRQFTESLYKNRMADERAERPPATQGVREIDRSVQPGPHTWQDDTRLPRSRPHGPPGDLSRRPPAGERTPEQMQQQENEEAKWGRKGFMSSFTNSAVNAFGAGYDAASPNKDKSGKTAYQRYVEKFYGPGVTSHNSPLALARAATGAVAQGLKTGAGFLGHAAAGLLGAPQGPSGPSGSRSPANTGGGIGSDTGAVSGITPTNRLYGGNPGTGAGISAYVPGTTRQGMDGVLDAISRAEGTTRNGYNEVLGYGAYGRPSKPITDMTLQEVHDYGRNTLFAGQRAKGIPEKELSSATGRYQITGDNIKTYATRWGLDMKTTKWTPQLQDRIAIDLAKNTPKGLANWEGFKTKTGQKLKQQATTALAYAPTSATTSPAIQAATEEAAGQGRRASGTSYERSPEIAQMQRDLNSRGAKLTVDGIRGPLTQAAEKQFLGSPTSVRTPSFTASPATPANNWSSLQGSATRTVNQRQDYVPTGSRTYTPVPASYTSGRGDEGRGVPSPPSMNERNMRVPTQSFVQTPYMNQPYTGPEWDVMPGAVQVPVTPTARMPRPRPDQASVQAVPVPEGGTVLEQLQQQLKHVTAVVGQIGGQLKDAARSGGMGQSFSGAQNSGLGYAGGRGYGGGSINRGTGGAINPNR
jgi:hypothetical protein